MKRGIQGHGGIRGDFSTGQFESDVMPRVGREVKQLMLLSFPRCIVGSCDVTGSRHRSQLDGLRKVVFDNKEWGKRYLKDGGKDMYEQNG